MRALKLKSERYFIELAYRGTAYHGWQIQKNAITVQQLVDEALSTVLRWNVETVGCGRTDTGVHAKQLYAHFEDKEGKLAERTDDYIRRINALLPRDIAAKRLIQVGKEAHARFDAIQRSYEYHIHFLKDPFKEGLSWQLRDQPNTMLMNDAARLLLQHRDFSCFSKSHTQVYTNLCTIKRAEWTWLNDEQLVFYISANRFLRNMVRAIVGTLLEIGSGKQPVAYINHVLDSKDRSQAGVSVPACGLYLTEVLYPYL